MAARSRRGEKTGDRRKNAPYVAGSAAPRLLPEEEVRRRARRDPGQAITVRRNQEKALQMNLPYVLALTVAAVCALYICVGYLRLQSSVTARLKHIESLEQEIETMKSDNDALETRINTSIDLDYIYNVATEELGMVYANRNQVRLYNKTESEYVRQYEDIPER